MNRTKIGILGCGSISERYIRFAKELYFDDFEVVACSDIVMERAKSRSEEFGIPRACTVEELLDDPEVEIVVNLTVPKVHAALSLSCLEHGKHVYTEKPLALDRESAIKILEMAKARKLRVGCAPDTFLGAPVQTARKLIDSGWIGRPVGVNAIMTQHGNELWHPDPAFFYQPGAGPMLDMGPYYFNILVSLIGPVESVVAMQRVTFPERKIMTKPKYGQIIHVEVPTYISGVFQFAGGAIGTFTTTFDVWNTKQPFLEIYGETGTMILPDPNFFTGSVLVSRYQEKEWTEFPILSEYAGKERGIGLADMARSIRTGKSHRASGELGYHVLDIMCTFDEAARSGEKKKIASTCARPAPLWEND